MSPSQILFSSPSAANQAQSYHSIPQSDGTVLQFRIVRPGPNTSHVNKVARETSELTLPTPTNSTQSPTVTTTSIASNSSTIGLQGPQPLPDALLNAPR